MISNAEHTLRSARTYSLKNGLKLNAKKTQCIFLGTRQIIPKIPENTTPIFHDTIIKPSSSVKNLGVHIDSYMTFETHVNEISKKVMGTLVYINRIKHCFDKPTRILAVQSLVISVLNYCVAIWGTTNNTLLTKTQKLQNFAIKVVCQSFSKPPSPEGAFCRISSRLLTSLENLNFYRSDTCGLMSGLDACRFSVSNCGTATECPTVLSS